MDNAADSVYIGPANFNVARRPSISTNLIDAATLIAGKKPLTRPERKTNTASNTTESTDNRTGITVEIIRRTEDIEPIAATWDSLVFDHGLPPALSCAWIRTHLELGGSRDQDWLCFAAFDGTRLVGVLPVVQQPIKVAGQTRTLLVAPRDPHTPMSGLVAAPGREEAAAAAIFESMAGEIPGLFGLEHVMTSPTTGLGSYDGPKIGDFKCLKTLAGFYSYIPTVAALDKLYASLSRHFRRRLKKHRGRLDRLEGVKFEFIAGEEAHPDLLDRFMEVEASGWKGRGGSAIGTSEQLVRFYRTLVERLHERGVLEWHFVRADNRTIAGHLAVRTGRTLWIWKIGYDEDYSRCSPGVSLMEETICRADEDEKTDGIDLVTDRDWQDHWKPEKRPYYDMWFYPHGFLPAMFGVFPKKARWALRSIPGLKTFVNRVRSITGGDD